MVVESLPDNPRYRLVESFSARFGIHRLQTVLAGLPHWWKSLQVSYRGGKYSIERLLALDAYIRHTSLFRVMVVVSGMLVPMCILVISQESLPLADPSAGWRANYGFWMRVGILAGVISNTMAIQAMTIIKAAALTSRQLALLFVCMSLSYPSISMVIAAYVGFPIPFFALSTIPIFFMLLGVWFVIIIGKEAFRKILQQSDEMTTFIRYICAQMLMPAVYPVYEVLFSLSTTTRYELPVILLLPIIKVVMKYIITLALERLEDMMPEEVILTVDFFHAVYLATCMQNSRSTATVITMIAVDVSQSLSMLYGFHKRTRTFLARLHRAAQTTSGDESVVVVLRLLCRSADTIVTQNLNGVRIGSCTSHSLSRANQDIVDRLEKLKMDGYALHGDSRGSFCEDAFIQVLPIEGHKVTRVSRLCAKVCGWKRATTILPFTPSGKSIPSKNAEVRPVEKTLSGEHPPIYRLSNTLREGLETLFTNECLIIASYLHTTIAMFYANFVWIMAYLPSAQYHTELYGVTRENVASTVQSVFVFSILEFISFALLALLVHLRCGMSVFYHLAFILETQTALVQGKVMMWMLIILAFRVVHFGTCCIVLLSLDARLSFQVQVWN